jgi:hypothetical protein
MRYELLGCAVLAALVGCAADSSTTDDAPKTPDGSFPDDDGDEVVEGAPPGTVAPNAEPGEANESHFVGEEDPVAGVTAGATPCSGKWADGIKTKAGLVGDTSETSGFASSKHYPGWAWMLRDSGRPASLYAAKQTTVGTFPVKEHKVAGATNKDWEDLVYGEEGGAGVLFILDTGAKLIYKVAEPDPNGTADVKVLAKYAYTFPDTATGTCGPTNNSESLFLFPPLTGKLHLVRKKSSPAGVYAFDTLSTSAPTTLKKVGDLKDASCISVASVSADGTLLVTAAHGNMRVRKGTGTLSSLITGPIIYSSTANTGDSVEAGDFYPWGSCNITLAAEGRNTFTFPTK